MPAPEEILAFPLTVYLSVVGTAMPDVGADPTTFDVAWSVLGSGGALDYDDNGVTVSHAETTFDVIPAGSTMPVKRFRTAEDLLTKLNLLDVSADTYAKCMNNSAVTTVAAGAGTAGSKKFSLFRGDKAAGPGPGVADQPRLDTAAEARCRAAAPLGPR